MSNNQAKKHLLYFLINLISLAASAQLPSINFGFSGNSGGCSPHTVVFNISNFTGNSPSTTYVLDFGDGSPTENYTQATIKSTVSHTYTTISCGNVFNTNQNAFGATITATNSSGSTIGTVTPIRISKIPNAEFTLDHPLICAGSSITFTNTSDPGVTYSGSNCITNPPFYWQIIGPSTGSVSSGSTGSDGGFPNDADGWSTGTSLLKMQFNTPGNYEMKLSIGNSCGLDDYTLSFCVVAAPTPLFSLSPNNGCTPPNLNVTANNTTVVQPNTCFPTSYSYNWSVVPTSGWSFSGSNSATGMNSGFTFNAAGNYTVTLTGSVNNLPGCNTSANQTVNVTAAPIINAGVDQSICAGSAPLQLTGSPASGTWSGVGVSSSGLYTPPTNVASVSNVTLTYTLPAGICPAQSDQVVITINPNLTVNITPDTPTICLGENINLTASSSISNSTFSWSPSNGLSSNSGTTVSASPSATTTYTVTATGSGCINSETVVVTVHPKPTVNVPTPATICAEECATLTAIGSGGLGPYTYTWSPATGLSTTTGASVSACPVSTTNYTVAITDSRGCTEQQQVIVTVTPLPVVNAGANISVCNTSNSYTLVGYTPVGGIWSGTGVTAAGVFSPSSPGPVTLTYSLTQNGCTASDQIVLTVTDPTPANAGADQNICLNSPAITLSGTPASGTWNGAGITPSGTFTPSSVGAFSLTYNFGSGNCEVSDTKVITVLALPSVSVDGVTICAGESANLTATASAGNAPYTYNWSPATGLSTSTDANVTANPTITTSYTVTITDANTCASNNQVTVTVTPTPTVNAGQDALVCNTPNPYTLTGFSPAAGTWSGTGVSATGIFTPSGPGSVTLTYSLTQNGCTGSDEIVLTVTDPTPANAGADQNICLNSPAITLAGTPIGGTWSGSGVTPTGAFTPSSVGTITLTYNFGSGNCAVSDEIMLTVLDIPSVSISDVSYCAGLSAELEASASGGLGLYSFSWSPLTGLCSGTGANITVDTTLTSVYTVMVTDENLCSDIQQVTVTVNPLPIIDAGIDISVCNTPTSTQLTGFSPENGTWTGSDISTDGLFIPSSAGIFSMIYSYTDNNGCLNKDSLLITVTDPGTVDAGSNDSICLNAPDLQLQGQPAGGAWTGNTLVNITGLFTPSEVGTFELYYNIGTGTCAVADTMLIIVNSLPHVEAGLDITICVNSPPFTFFGQVPTDLGTWIWTGTGIVDTSSGVFDASSSGGGIFTSFYTYTETASGCSNTDSLQVIVNELTPVNIMSDSLSACLTPFNIMLTATPWGGIWTGDDLNFDYNLDGIQDTAGFIPQINGWFTANYTYTDNHQCVNTDTLHIQVVSPVDVDAGSDVAFCFSEQDTVQLIGLPSGGQWNAPENLNSISISGNLNLAQADTFLTVYSVGTGSCQTWDSCQVIIFPLPELYAGIDTFRCIDDPCFNLIPEFPLGGTWSGTGITNAEVGTFCAHVALDGNHKIYYTIDTTYFYQSLSSTCYNRDSLEVLVVPMPSSGLVIDSVLCVNTDVQLGNNSSGTATDFEWIILDANSLDTIFYSNEFSPIINLHQPGSFILRLKAISQYGCSVETTTDFIVVTPPLPDFSISEETSCAPFQGTLQNGSGGHEISYLWDFGSLFLQSTDTVPIMPIFLSPVLADTLYFVELSLSNLCGTRTVKDSVLIRPQPIAELGIDYSLACSPATILLQNASYGSPSTYFWDFGNGVTSSDSLPYSIDYTTQNFYTEYLIQLTVSNSCGTDSDSTIVTVVPSSIELGELLPQTACIPFQFSFSAPLNDQTFYTWDFGDGNGGIGQNIEHSYSTAGEYTLKLFVSNFCLTDTLLTSIVLGEAPVLAIGVSEVLVCRNSEIIINNLSESGSGFQWIFNGVSQSTYSNQVNYTLFQDGINAIQLTAVNASNGCRDTVQTLVEIAPFPEISISATPDTGCYPLNVTLQNQSTGANAWEWTFADNSASALQEPSLLIETVGEFDIQLIAHNYVSFELDCPDTANISVWVDPSPVSNFSLSASEGCGPVDTVLTINQSTGAIENIWSWGQNISNEFQPPITFIDTGLKLISLKVTNAFGCSDSSAKNYKVYGQPILNFTFEPQSGCPPLEVNFINSTQYSDSTNWYFGDGFSSNFNSPIHIYENTGNYSITVHASTGDGLCSADSMIFQAIEVFPTANSAFTINPKSINQEMPIIILSNQSSDYNSLHFYNDSLSILDDLPAKYSLINPDTGIHHLMLIANNAFNCPDTSINNIYVKGISQFYLPNSFSPNGDGINDRYKIYFERTPELFWVNIYNRWGQLIYTSTDPEEGWDGTFMNTGKSLVQNEVYILKFSALIEGILLNSLLFYNITMLR